LQVCSVRGGVVCGEERESERQDGLSVVTKKKSQSGLTTSHAIGLCAMFPSHVLLSQ
jgi:hypothetical protein